MNSMLTCAWRAGRRAAPNPARILSADEGLQ